MNNGTARRHLVPPATALAVALLAGMLVGVGAQAAPLAATGEGSDTAQSANTITRRLNLSKGNAEIVDLPRDAAEVVVADPTIANAIVRTSRKLYVIAGKPGETTIFALDAQGHRIETIDVSIDRASIHGIGELDRILKTTMPTSNIVLHRINDTLILTGEVDSDLDAKKAEDIAKAYVSGANNPADEAANNSPQPSGSPVTAPNAQTSQATTNISFGSSDNKDKNGNVINSLVIRGQDQVMLKVTVAEIQRQVAKQLGITSSSATGNWGTFTQQNGLPLNLQTLTSGATTFGRGNLSATLTAFERDGVARVLAEPTVTAVSGESAKFTAGGQIPIPQGEQCASALPSSCTPNIGYKDYGVTLNFTPVVLSEGRILLHVSTEVTEVDPQQSVTFQSVNIPGFRTRKNETSVELPSGGSIVSAGLLQVESQQVMNGLPGLMNLPILGQLFRSRDYQRQETELMIIITPYIAKPIQQNDVARPDDGFADASDPQAALLGHVNRIYSTTDNPTIIKNFKGRVGFIDD